MTKKLTGKYYSQLMNSGELPLGGAWLEAGSSVMRKTGDWRILKPIVDDLKCINCAQCWAYCPDSSVLIVKDDQSKTGMKMAGYDYDHCKGCGICAAICPTKAIEMVKDEK